MGTLVRALACSAVVPFLFAGGALAQNFHWLSQQKGCESVMAHSSARFNETCNRLNKAKDEDCGPGVCDIDAHVKQIEKYKADVARLAAGDIPNGDTAAFKASIEKTKAELDQRKNDAATQSRATNACVVARQNVYDFFENQVIPGTLKAAAEANTLLAELRTELDNARGALTAARVARDALAGANPETDRELYEDYVEAQAEYDQNAEAYREAENNLGQFNSFHGDEINYYVNRLITYYREEQGDHKIQIDQQKNIYETCKKVADMSY
jgi:hypothetical protein